MDFIRKVYDMTYRIFNKKFNIIKIKIVVNRTCKTIIWVRYDK